ncbi:DedA family protein [Sphingomonas sp. Ag1]|jgi:membrane protein DedA with SNARE-associated domain|uniref:DedA family protein n=1 Tax=Sphingomonas sp. Ag1 TaxID=1642949 RepID=UPI000696281D|nr:VTT domain-containing protein [Sphingomonas sp. Ag1]
MDVRTMHDRWSDVAELIAAHREIAGLLIGALTFLECTAVVGVLFPATATMLAIGGMVGARLLDPIVIGPPAIIGAILGGWLSFRMGRWLGPRVLYRRPFRRHRPAAARARLLFSRHGVALLLAARYYAPARATVPMVAGILNMRRSRFHIADAAAAVLWVLSLLTIGSLAAAALDEVAIGATGKLILFAAMVILTSAISTAAMKRLFGGERGRVRGGMDAREAARP